MRIAPAPDGSLHLQDPAPGVRWDLSNPRLFAALDGAGNLSSFRLPEGIAVLRRWQVAARADGIPVQWHSGTAIGRSWALQGQAGTIAITCRTACDGASPALVQLWTATNTGSAAHIFTFGADVGFDLQRPTVRVGPSAFAARTYRLLRDHRQMRRLLGTRRWGLLNVIGEAQKRLRPRTQRPVTITPLRDGLRAQGDIAAVLRATDPPLTRDARPDGARLTWRFELPPGASVTLALSVAAAADVDPAAYGTILADADRYADWLRETFEHDDPLLRTLFVACLHTALAMYKELPEGFAGLWAGPGYAYPPRIYFRDGYWTALAVLPYRPEWVRRHLLTLADGVHTDGVCPSGLIDRALLPPQDQDAPGAADWLADHQDSPAFFVLLLDAYMQWTGDSALLDAARTDGRSLWDCARACLGLLAARPAKERAPNDWADNVLRSAWVTYDLGLAYGALQAGAAIAARRGEHAAATGYAENARQIATLLDIHLWDADRGYYLDYRRYADAHAPAHTEDHLALDTLVTIVFGAASPDRATSILNACRRTLQTRNNPAQPYGDWGVMCCWPPYRLHEDLFAKSAHPYRYHNGADWPYLDALYARLLLERDDPDWRYVLTRWWQVQLERGYPTPLEFLSPPHPVGGPLQGWSGLAVHAPIAGGLGLTPAPDGSLSPRMPPWGACTLRHLIIGGQPRTVIVDSAGLRIE